MSVTKYLKKSHSSSVQKPLSGRGLRRLLIVAAAMFSLVANAQEAKLYHPENNAEKDISAAVKKAKQENKFVLLQGGGNWCSWCIEFARFCKADPKIDSLLNENFVWYHLNWSKENKNEKTFARYGYPQRFGYPVFIILNGKGERLNTQNSEYLEDGKKSYDRKKVIEFLEAWTPKALDPKSYG
ncbi:MAG TPA: thioredoxin family protein, partial [Ferruginibacter sp.]|nr:thioredoxin family protein [Ferruginibacter sp.]